ncbi:hypothetical protein [Halalkalibacillus halophilus]|uniref:hypothetical protein n=1 Tax=Halalkalibacillus halophilus TaxID=392827 RepID=UPI0012EC0559|nr:hypothetical protein [Halalkalibacillus halophilus]
MSDERQDVVMFPGWRKELEKKVFEAIKQKNYEQALLHIKKLESFNAASSDILTAKIIAQIELGHFEQAIGLCRRLMKEEEHYFKYLHIYLSILFQTSQYTELIDLLDEIYETEKIPAEYQEQFMQLYDMSKDLRSTQSEQESENHMNHFFESLESGNFQEQWKLLSMHRKYPIEEYLEDLIPYLSDARLNPVIKTGILQWLMDEEVAHKVEIEKFGTSEHVKPIELKDVLESDFALKVMNALSDLENEDPTLYAFVKQILYRYLYIQYPLVPEDDQANVLAEAVQLLAKKYLQLDQDGEIDQIANEEQLAWMEEIEHLEKLYFSQIED